MVRVGEDGFERIVVILPLITGDATRLVHTASHVRGADSGELVCFYEFMYRVHGTSHVSFWTSCA